MADKELDWQPVSDKDEPGSDAEREARLDEQARAAYAAGRWVSHERVAAWLRSWGTEQELPCPEPE